MLFRTLRVESYRNLRRVSLSFSPRVNVLLGPNGHGKTNILEALYLLAGFRSFRGARTRELIREGAEAARLVAEVEADGVERAVELTLRPKGKAYLVDGKAPASLAEWVGRLVIVTFSPDDLFLVKGEPEIRRRWLDRVIFLLDAEHLRCVMQYQKALKTRNALLKDGMFGRDLMLLDVFDQTLARCGARVRASRAKWVPELSQLVDEELHSLTGGVHHAALEDTSEVESSDEAGYLAALMKRREDDVRRRLTSWGVHHDDLRVVISQKEARRYASQGEQRALTLAMKLAETRLVRSQRNVAPVLLLDDVTGELDSERNQFLFRELERHEGQVFVACTELPPRLAETGVSGLVFDVSSGEIRQRN